MSDYMETKEQNELKEEGNTRKPLLQLLSIEELRELALSFGEHKIAQNATRKFLIERISGAISDEDLLKQRSVVLSLLAKSGAIIDSFWDWIQKLEKDDLRKVCEDVEKKELVKEDATRSQILKHIMADIPLSELLKSKHLSGLMKAKSAPKMSAKLLEKEVKALETSISSFSNDVKALSEEIAVVKKELVDISSQVRSLEKRVDVEKAPDIEALLRALHEEAISIGEINPESFRGVSERLQKKLGVDERTLVFKGMELLLTHYLLAQVRLLPWKPSLDEFLRIVNEEFERVKITGNQAEIPALREHVGNRMNISDQLFDALLTEAWKKDYVKLDVGAPIGEYNVKYLTTEEGRKFFYVKLKKVII
jgi:hypothetical protein